MAEAARHTAIQGDAAMRCAPRGAADAVATEHGDDDRTAPLRRCLVTGQSRPKNELLRFVIGPDGRVVPDLDCALPGRGLWVTAGRDELKRAVDRRLFAKSAHRAVAVDDDLVDQVERLLVRRCVELLGLARRAGNAVAGYERVSEFLRDRPGSVLLTATDAAAGGAGKLAARAPDARQIHALDGHELGQAFGADHRVHAVVGPGRLADLLFAAAERLAPLRGSAASMTMSNDCNSEDMSGR